MKSFKVSAIIAGLYAIPAARELVAGNGTRRVITHRILLHPSKSLKYAEEQCAQILRDDGETPVAFALHRNDGLYALDMDRNQLSVLCRNGLRLDELELNAKGATFNATVDLREVDDKVVNVRDGSEIIIEKNHAVVQNPEVVVSPAVMQSITIGRNVAAIVAQQYGIGAGTTQQTTTPKAAEIPADELPLDEEPAEVVTSQSNRNKQRTSPGKVPAGGRKATAANTRVS